MKIQPALSRLTRILKWLQPDSDARRYLPLIAFPLVVFAVVLLVVTNRFYECDHYPDITNALPASQHYRCNSPRWEVTCYHRIKGPLTDVCLRNLGPGANFIYHKKSLLDSQCQANLGPQARVSGSAGCECSGLLDREGRCITAERYCRSLYGEQAFPAIVSNPEGYIETFISKDADKKTGAIYGVCRCPEEMHFDTGVSQCRSNSAS